MPSPPEAAALDPRAIERHFAQSSFVSDVGYLGPNGDGRVRLVVVPDTNELRRHGLTGVRELIRFEFETLAVRHDPPLRVPDVAFTFDPLPRTREGAVDPSVLAATRRSHVVLRGRTPWPDGRAARLVGAALDELRRDDRTQGIDADTNLELDLDLDSLARAELFADIERRLGFAPTTSGITWEDVFTAGDLVARIERAGDLVQDIELPSPPHRDRWTEMLADHPDGASRGLGLDSGRTVRAIAFWLILRVLRLLTAPVLRVRVVGREHLPSRGPVLLCPNHESFFDAFLVSAALPFGLLRDVFYLGATEYFASRTMATIARLINLVPVDADRNLARALQVGASGLRRGKVLVIFPEGERSIDGTVRTFRDGTARLAQATGSPMVPIALRGMFPVWPRGFGLRREAFRPWHPVRATIVIGAPIAAPAPGSVEQTTRVLRDTVQSLWADAATETPKTAH